MILVDTSALGKLLVAEAESDAVREKLRSLSGKGELFVISTLATTELRRLAIRMDIAPERVEPVLAPFRVLRASEGIFQLAGRLPYRHLGTLDAIHLATAVSAEARGIMTFDLCLAEATRAEGLEVLSPRQV